MELVTVNLGNREHNVSALQQRMQLQRLAAARPDVIVTQEARSGWVTPTGYRALPVILPGAREDRIVVRKDRQIVAHGYVRMHPGREHLWPARSMPFAAIDRGTRRPLYVVGVHLNSKVETRGRFTADGERRAFTRHHVQAVADFARFVCARFHAECIVLGDFNVDAYADRRERDPLFPTVRLGLASLVEALPATVSGTLGSRRVDRVFASDGLRVSVRDLARRKPYDHQPVGVRAV